jgi:hypothetical protein
MRVKFAFGRSSAAISGMKRSKSAVRRFGSFCPTANISLYEMVFVSFSDRASSRKGACLYGMMRYTKACVQGGAAGPATAFPNSGQ